MSSYEVEVVRLNCGITIPILGMGTYSFDNNRETTELAVHTALKVPPLLLLHAWFFIYYMHAGRCTYIYIYIYRQVFNFEVNLQMGYRHFDTAKIYYSETALGNALTEAIVEGSVKREDLFVSSKLWGSDHHDPVSALNQTLK